MTTDAEWAGAVGGAWAAEWERTDRSFADLAGQLDAAILAEAPGGSGIALDIGCGAGATSLALARARPDLLVTGVDLSSDLLAVAVERAAGLPNLAFINDDAARAAAALAPVDLLVSRHGVMFFDDPVAGFAALHGAAAPAGRLVFSCFRAAALNRWAVEIATAITGALPAAPTGYAPGPFAFADPDFVRATLAAAGWSAIEAAPVDFTYRAGAGDDPVADALGFFRRIGPTAPALRLTPPEEQGPILDRIVAVLQRHLTHDAVDFPAAAWIWSARAA